MPESYELSVQRQILTPLISQALDFVIYIIFFKFGFPVCVVDCLLKNILTPLVLFLSNIHSVAIMSKLRASDLCYFTKKYSNSR